jgi:hypothetical protein
MIFDDIPAGTSVFLDANTFVYAILASSSISFPSGTIPK